MTETEKENKKTIKFLSIALITAIGIIVFEEQRLNTKEPVVSYSELLCTEENEESVCTYKDLTPFTGTAIANYPNGNLFFKIHYKNAKANGSYKTYYKNGRLKSEANNKVGKLYGLVKKYHENGQLESIANYKAGKLNGISKTYYNDGQLAMEFNFKEDKLNGVSKFFYENGQLMTKIVWKEDVSLSKECYDQKGKEADCKSITKN